MNLMYRRRLPVTVLTLLGTALTLPAASETDWLGDTALTLREAYDGNVFLSDVNSQYLPPHYQATVVPGSVVALKNKSAAVTTGAARLTLNLLPATGTNVLSQFSLAYTPEFDVYEGVASETHYDHRLLGKFKGQRGPWSFNLDENFLYVDGSKYSPTYPGDELVSAYNIVAPRERRQQIQDRLNASVRRDGDDYFLRASAGLQLYDLQTHQFNDTGYINYCSRYDVHGAIDAGYKLTDQTALTLGEQVGHQYQEKYSFSPYDSSSDYTRILGGLEGRPFAWLTLKCQAGPDFRSYASAAPVSNLHPVTYYDECSATARLSAHDTLTLDGRQFQWVSSLGNVPYFDTTAALNWHRVCTSTLTTDLGIKFMSADYRSGGLPPCRRVDTETCFTSGIGYELTPHLAVNLAGEFDLGLNDLSGVTDPSVREFHRFLVSLGTTWTF